MMDTSTARALLPCLVCGDLPPEVAAQVEAALQANPELAREAAFLRSSREACMEALQQHDDFPALPAIDDSMTPIPVLHLEEDEVAPRTRAPRRAVLVEHPRASRPTGSWRGLLLGTAAAAALLLGLELAPSQGPEDAIFARHQALAGGQASLQPGSSPEALAPALRQAGVFPALVRVPDLSGMGLQIVGGTAGLVDGGTGSAVVYELDGQRFVCEFAAHVDRGGDIAASGRVGDTRLWAYERDGRGVVVWLDHGLYCVFSGPMGAEQMLAMVSKRMELRQGRG